MSDRPAYRYTMRIQGDEHNTVRVATFVEDAELGEGMAIPGTRFVVTVTVLNNLVQMVNCIQPVAVYIYVRTIPDSYVPLHAHLRDWAFVGGTFTDTGNGVVVYRERQAPAAPPEPPPPPAPGSEWNEVEL
jgi:hypothetical protein